jgi:hypothetical protein
MSEQLQEETVTIPKSRFDKLAQDSDFLEALKQAGVDNWNGYGDAQEILESWYEDQENTE